MTAPRRFSLLSGLSAKLAFAVVFTVESRKSERALSNAHRAHESAAGEMQIKDVLDEIITFNSVSIIVSEFIPYGANNMVTTNGNLGSQERVQGGLFTPGVETDKVATKMYKT